MKIRGRTFKQNLSVYVIAEIGINHDGQVENALELVTKAKAAGCDAIKLQIIDPEISYNSDTVSYKIFKKALLSTRELSLIRNRCRHEKIDFWATVGDSKSLKRANHINVDGFKISSGLMTNYPLIEKVIRKGKPIVFSTGMSNEDEIKKLIEFIESFDFHNYALLHCVSLYPAPADTIHLNVLNRLQALTEKVIGYSDHYLGETAVLAAVSKGAKMIEKHFTLDKTQKGADHKISAMPLEMKSLVSKIREIEKMIVQQKFKVLSSAEKKTRKMMRRLLVLNLDKKPGEKVRLKDLEGRRFLAGQAGLDPRAYQQVMMKKSKISISKHKPLKMEWFE